MYEWAYHNLINPHIMKTTNKKTLILCRIKEHYGFKTDVELADFLGIKRSTLSNWTKRDSIDYDLIFSKCEHVNINWLLFGIIEQGDEASETNQKIKSQAVAAADDDIEEMNAKENSIHKNSLIIRELFDRLQLQSEEIGRLKSKVKSLSTLLTTTKGNLSTDMKYAWAT